MPSTPQLQSDLLVLVRSLPTVKDAVQAKQGLRNLRDELLYRRSDKPVLLTDAAKMEELEISDLLQAWFNSPAGESIVEDIKSVGADDVLEEFDAALKQVELIQLNLAYAASTEDLSRYHRWFNQVVGRSVMLDVHVDRQLLAGVSFVYQNHLHDYSLAQQMPEIEAKLLQNAKAGERVKVEG
jgi:F0F1-type ATP synthase delta subunit